jgi:hypothetical protein
MRGETWVSLGACLAGAVIPVAWLGPHLLEGFVPWLAAGVCVLPFALVALTAWSVRRDRRAACVAAAVSLLVLAIGLAGWSWAVRDREGGALILAGLLFVPGTQVLVWLAGAVLAGRRREDDAR